VKITDIEKGLGFKDGLDVTINGVAYPTVIDNHGVQRFVKNRAVDFIVHHGEPAINELGFAYGSGKIPLDDLRAFYMMIGYSVSGYCDIPAFLNDEVINPMWDEENTELVQLHERLAAAEQVCNLVDRREVAEDELDAAIANWRQTVQGTNK